MNNENFTGFGVYDKRTKRIVFTHESKYTAQNFANNYGHRESNGIDLSLIVVSLPLSNYLSNLGNINHV